MITGMAKNFILRLQKAKKGSGGKTKKDQEENLKEIIKGSSLTLGKLTASFLNSLLN
jgi:hypothetical protein